MSTPVTCIQWKDNLFRAKGEPMTHAEIDYYLLWIDGKPYKSNWITQTKLRGEEVCVFPPVKPTAVCKMKTVDTGGRESVLSVNLC